MVVQTRFFSCGFSISHANSAHRPSSVRCARSRRPPGPGGPRVRFPFPPAERVMQTIGSSAAEPSLSSLGYSVAEQRRTKRRRGPHVVGARSRCEGKISSGRLARASGGAIRRACASALAARFEQISNATVRWCAPKDSGGAKPMIEVFAVWTTFFLPNRVGYLTDEVLRHHHVGLQCPKGIG